MVTSKQELLNYIPINFTKIYENKKIVVIGCGGIGSLLVDLLVRNGFKNLVLVDFDIVEENNLSRQFFFKKDIGKLKVSAIYENLKRINNKISIEKISEKLTEKNIEKICFNSDLIVDGTDNFETRKIINSFCERKNKDWIYNGAIKDEVVSCTFYGNEKKFSSIFPKKVVNEKCSTVGILGSTTFLSASLAYNMILKYFLKIKYPYFIKVNLWKNEIFKLKIR